MQEQISFGIWLRKQRRALDLSRQAFADQVGCAEVTLRRIEAGTLKPSKELAGILLEKLGIPEIELPQWISFARGLSGLPLSSTPASNKPISNLPASITTFIGREKEQSDVIKLINKHRLVTLTGSGGVGKTRLSIKVGEQVLRSYADGVWLLELASLSDPTLISQTAAALFGIRTQSHTSIIDLLASFLSAKSALLIIDNCEHLLEACAHFIYVLLNRCSHLKILVTSRELLGITGEAIYRVPSLGIPDIQQLLDTLKEFESVKLFEERAQLVQFDFSLKVENASSIAQICHRLDGIPLAIELAAAKVGIFSTEQIAKQLDESFNFLTRESRTELPHHQTLRASINWSWNLLTDSEKTLIRQLSVFAGGWTLEAAQAVCDGDVLYLLNSLVMKSLITMYHEREVRYRFHETIRQYAYEKLVEAGEEQDIRNRHLKYFLKLSEQIEPELVGPKQTEWITRTSDERNNLRAALEHAIRTDVESGLYISGRLELFWAYVDSREGMRWLAAFLQKPEAQAFPHARAKALCTQSGLLFFFEEYNEAQAAAEESLALFRAVKDECGEVDSLISLGWIFTLGSLADPAKGAEVLGQALSLARSLGDIGRQASALNVLGWDLRDHKRAFAYWGEAIALFRQAGNWGGLAHNLSELGYYLLTDGQLDAAQKCLDESSLLFQQLNIKGRSHLLSGYGQIALMRGDYEQARAFFQEDARFSNELGNRITYHWSIVRLGFVELRAGSITKARKIFAESAHNFQKDGSRMGVVFTLEGMSSQCISAGKLEVAAQLIGWADATRQSIGERRPKLEEADVDKVIAACIAKMGEDAFSNAYEEGKKMSLDEAVQYALES